VIESYDVKALPKFQIFPYSHIWNNSKPLSRKFIHYFLSCERELG